MSRSLHPARLFLILLVALAAVVVPRACGALWIHGPQHPKKMARQQVEELEQQWRTATLSGDIATMDTLLSEDYVGISWNGQVNTKAMQLDRIRTKTFAVTKLDLVDSKVKVLGNVAIVTSLAQIEGINEGAPIKGMFRYTRVYQHTASGAWKITNFEATRIPDGPHHLPQG